MAKGQKAAKTAEKPVETPVEEAKAPVTEEKVQEQPENETIDEPNMVPEEDENPKDEPEGIKMEDIEAEKKAEEEFMERVSGMATPEEVGEAVKKEIERVDDLHSKIENLNKKSHLKFEVMGEWNRW